MIAQALAFLVDTLGTLLIVALLLRFWLPVWIAFQQQAIEHALACGRPYLLTDQLPAQHHANPSSLPAAWRQRLERLVPPLPEAHGSQSGDAGASRGQMGRQSPHHRHQHRSGCPSCGQACPGQEMGES